jgi:hypothetical protein
LASRKPKKPDEARPEESPVATNGATNGATDMSDGNMARPGTAEPTAAEPKSPELKSAEPVGDQIQPATPTVATPQADDDATASAAA